MGAKQSSAGPRMRTYSGSGQSGSSTGNAGHSGGELAVGGSAGAGQATAARARARSLGSFHPSAGHSPSLSIPNNNGSGGVSGGISLLGAMSPDSDSSTPEDAPFGRSFTHSLPVHLSFFTGIKCPVCSKSVAADELECHLVICLTKPRISYNEDVLTEDKGECVICLEDLKQGDTIARLPCLCIYHKMCIDRWFEVNRSCPEHPSD